MRRSPLARPLTVVAAAALVAGVLAGCTPGGFGGCPPVYQPGDASDAVSASGDLGTEPSVDYPTPLIAEEPQLTVLQRGEGDPIGAYTTVAVDVTVYDAASDEVLTATLYDGLASAALVTTSPEGNIYSQALLCATPGSRVSIVSPVEAFQTGEVGDQELSGQNVIVVMDVLGTFLGKANGLNQIPRDGMPTVVTAVDGTPSIAVGFATVPDSPTSSVIKAGSGAVAAEGDTAILQLRSFSWAASGDVTVGSLDTWSSAAQAHVLDDTNTKLPADVIAAVVGQKVGSQLLVVVPTEGGAAAIVVVDVVGVLGADD